METISEKTQLDTKQRPENGGETLPNEYMCSTAPASVAQETLQKRDWENCESQRIRAFVLRLCLLGMSEATPIKTPQHDCPNMILKEQQQQ